MAKTLKTVIKIGGKLEKSLQNAFKTLEKKGEAIDKAFETTKKVGVASFKAVTATVVALGTSIMAVSETTRDYRKDLAKMYNNAEMAGVAQKDAWSGLEDLYAMSGEFDSANEAMSNLLATGYKGKDLTKIIEAVNGATIKWQDTITQESLADAINETVMSGKSMGQFDEILSRSGVNLDTFNDGLLNCRTLAERQQYVLNWLAKSGLTEVNAGYQEQNKSLVEAYKADLKYQDSMAKLGEVAEPIATLFKNGMSTAIMYFTKKLENVDIDKVATAVQTFGRYAKQAFDTLFETLQKVDWDLVIVELGVIMETISGILSIILPALPAVTPLLITLAAAITAVKVAQVAYNNAVLLGKGIQIGYNAVKTVAIFLKKKYVAALIGATLSLNAYTAGTNKATLATKLATLAQKALNLVMKMNPIGLIITLIAGLVAVFVTLYNKCDWFKKAWDKIWKGIKKTVETVVKSIKKILGGVGDFFKNLFGGGDKNINVNVNETANAAKNALGGTYSSPLKTWVAEGGDTETIVPHNNKPRSRALALTAAQGTGLNVGGNTFVFSPNITVNGGNASEVRSIIDDEINKFKAQMEEWTRGQRRLAY